MQRNRNWVYLVLGVGTLLVGPTRIGALPNCACTGTGFCTFSDQQINCGSPCWCSIQTACMVTGATCTRQQPTAGGSQCTNGGAACGFNFQVFWISGNTCPCKGTNGVGACWMLDVITFTGGVGCPANGFRLFCTNCTTC